MIHWPQVFCITTFHGMNSYPMRLAQSMLLSQRKCNESAEICRWKRWDFYTEQQMWFLLVLPMMHPARSTRLPCIWQSPFLASVPRIHVQFIPKGETAFTQSQSQHSGSQPLFPITTQLQYLWALLLMERLFRCTPSSHPHTSPYLPISFVVLILFCGPILMKSLMVNHEGIWRGL